MLEYDAYAKINLSLELPDIERNDGYHEIITIMQSVSLADHLILEKSDDIEITCSDENWRAEQSLVSKALVLMQHEIETEEGAYIHITKKIPLSSGMGGDSADAAAVIVGLNKLWNGKLSVSEMKLIAEKLGSDVPFFINGGTQLCRGRGEIVSPIPVPDLLYLIICHPEVETPLNKTKTLYGAITKQYLTDGQKTLDLAWKIRTSETVFYTDLFNTFDDVAYQVFTGLLKVKNDFETISKTKVIVSGAGPTLFTICNTNDERLRVYNEMVKKGYKCSVVDPVKPRIINEAPSDPEPIF